LTYVGIAARARRGRTADLEQLERERFDLVDRAVERGWVSKLPAEHGVRPDPAGAQLRECVEQRSYTQKLWTAVRMKAAYLPG
jgi:hypothetical protein